MQFALDLGDSVVLFQFIDDTLYPVNVDTDSREGKDANEAIVEYIRGRRDSTTMDILRQHATPKYAAYHPSDPNKPNMTNIRLQ